MELALICLCGHSPFQHILLVGNCKACKDSSPKHQPHCYKYRDKEVWRKQLLEKRKRYDFLFRGRHAA